ncbi:MAG TPA: cysteine desulfurase family protein [Blastocatellia bacterium]|jgi:cysteine desulfurase|nr:cysteine desulfurase family protein [Blastocatellia bacterium]
MRVYLDNSATTATAPEVIDAMLPYFSEESGNAQSVHSFGQRAKAAIENARRQVASLLNAAPGEIVFVSGGTEADNLALRGISEAHLKYGRHIITSKIEHPAVLAMSEALEAMGCRVTYLPVSSSGLVGVEELASAIRDDTILISIMHANNETGSIQPIEEIAKLVARARASGKNHLHFHTDAVQSVGKIPVDVKRLGVDLLSLSGHKIHGPKGVGALYVRKGTRLGKLFYGGHHERDRRPGTENVPGIVGLGRAAELARIHLGERAARLRTLRDYFESQAVRRIPGASINGASINGDTERRIPNVSNMSFQGVDGESLLIALDLKGIAVSTGSACASGSLEPSHVLTALGLTREQVRGSLRLSLGAYTTREEIDYALDALEETIAKLREMLPEGGTELIDSAAC